MHASLSVARVMKHVCVSSQAVIATRALLGDDAPATATMNDLARRLTEVRLPSRAHSVFSFLLPYFSPSYGVPPQAVKSAVQTSASAQHDEAPTPVRFDEALTATAVSGFEDLLLRPTIKTPVRISTSDLWRVTLFLTLCSESRDGAPVDRATADGAAVLGAADPGRVHQLADAVPRRPASIALRRYRRLWRGPQRPRGAAPSLRCRLAARGGTCNHPSISGCDEIPKQAVQAQLYVAASQAVLHFALQLKMAAAARALAYPVMPVSVTVVCSLRSLPASLGLASDVILHS